MGLVKTVRPNEQQNFKPRPHGRRKGADHEKRSYLRTFSSQGQNEQSYRKPNSHCAEYAENQGYNVVNAYNGQQERDDDSRPVVFNV